MAHFSRYIGIDYSGAQTPNRSLPGLRVYCATQTHSPKEVLPPPGPRKYFTRRGLAEWLAEELSYGPPACVGIDHGFSFPMRYFETHKIPLHWPTFLEDFKLHWPTHEDEIYVDYIRDGRHGKGAARQGNSRWRRLTEERCRAKSVFHFDVQGSVAKSTHAGLPWLLYLRRQLGEYAHFWPFDGWSPSAGVSVIAEVYPALWSRNFPSEGRDSHQQDAFSIAQWMSAQDRAGRLSTFFEPALAENERKAADVEGWILGIS